MKTLTKYQTISIKGGNKILDFCSAGGILFTFVKRTSAIGIFCAGYSFGHWLHEQVYD